MLQGAHHDNITHHFILLRRWREVGDNAISQLRIFDILLSLQTNLLWELRPVKRLCCPDCLNLKLNLCITSHEVVP